jgi:hypothetical protein
LIAAGPGAAIGTVVTGDRGGGNGGAGWEPTELGGLLLLPGGGTDDGTVEVATDVLELASEPGTVSAPPVLVPPVSADDATDAEAPDVLESEDPVQALAPTASNANATAVFRSTGSLSPLISAINPHNQPEGTQ